jgi:hypothetical protein
VEDLSKTFETVIFFQVSVPILSGVDLFELSLNPSNPD